MQRVLRSLLILLYATNAYTHCTGPSCHAFAGSGRATSIFGRSTTLFQARGGSELAVGHGTGIGAELGYPGPRKNGSNDVVLFSLNGLHRFVRLTEIKPFFTGGYSLGFGSNTAHFGKVGGGVTTGLQPATGPRVELRDKFCDAQRTGSQCTSPWFSAMRL